MIGTLYNARGVVVGQAAGFIAAADTPLPKDSTTVFDETLWLGHGIDVGAATAGTFTLTLTGGPFGATPVDTAAITFDATSVALAAAVQAVLPAGYTAAATGAAPTWSLSISGPGGADIAVTGDPTGLTGGALTVTDSPWKAAGATEQGWAVNYTPSTQDINIEEQPTPVQQQVTSAKFEFTANLAEDTVQSLQWALSATASVQAADATHHGKTTLTMQPTLPTLAVALETKNMFGFPRRYYVPRMTCAATVGQTFRRANSSRLVPVTFGSICNLDEIQVVEITSAPTA